jgi:hypothetical protein
VRQLFRIVPILIALALVGYIGWLFYLTRYGPEALEQQTIELLHNTTLDRLEFHEATLGEAVEAYRQSLSEVGIGADKIQVRVMPGAGHDWNPQNPGHPTKQSFKLSAVVQKEGHGLSAMEAGLYVSAIFNLDVSIVGKEVRLHRPGDTPLIHRTVKVDFNFSPEARGLPLLADGTYDFRPFLEPHGVAFPSGAWAKYRRGSGKLEVFLRQKDINLVEILGGSAGELTWRDRVKSWFRM